MKRNIKDQFIPSIKDYSSRKEWEEICWQNIVDSEALPTIVTSHERRDLVIRAAVIDRLQRGISYREIGRELWVSSQTVSGIKKSLKEKDYRSYNERSKTERKKKTYSSLRKNLKKNDYIFPKGWVPRRTKYGIVYFPAGFRMKQ